jgi:dephospho-CoA kinase
LPTANEKFGLTAVAIIVITGGVASGKSTVARLFRELGVEVIDSDQLARELVEPGQSALAAIVDTFGADMVDADGRLDRRRMRELIFSDEQQKQALESILHPQIMQLAKQRCTQALAASNMPYVLLEVPLYADIEPWPWVERVLLVDCSEQTQLLRLQARDHVDASQAGRMLDAQSSRAERLNIADDVILNEHDLQQLHQAVALQHQDYLRRFS